MLSRINSQPFLTVRGCKLKYMVVAEPVTHVIFDFDGVLVDSETRISEAVTKALARFGKNLTQKLMIMGRSKPEMIRALVSHHSLDQDTAPQQLLKAYEEECEALLEECDALPGVERLVRHLNVVNVPMAICTSSGRKSFGVKTRKRHHDWLKLIPVKVLAGDDPAVKKGKPAADPCLVTLSRLTPPALSANRCLVFEDSVNGVRSALAAGMLCIMIPQRKFVDVKVASIIEELRPQLADLLESMEEFVPEKYGFPPF